jgi:hypothetical protein
MPELYLCLLPDVKTVSFRPSGLRDVDVPYSALSLFGTSPRRGAAP